MMGILYTGKSVTSREKNQSKRVVEELAAPFKNSNGNITTDNILTMMPLAKHLLSWRLTLVETLKENKSREKGASKTRAELSIVFDFHENVTICSDVAKKSKAVILLSTMHHDKTIEVPKQKPEILHFYNKTVWHRCYEQNAWNLYDL
ncbi:piggybac transposable element-derived protein 4-like protein [Lasius niger]|uniref:Piggybac transposable element-derived protein 4-like protein n=1 Tax=Lasius niger TaxID=67767 RepID=A0A0J7K1D9_LASNI|nr:piggybac transposable element-derived protein 4-like protein [Lasius niger]